MFTELCIIKKSYDEGFLNKLKEIGYSIDYYGGDEKDCEYIINIPQYKAISFGWFKGFYLDMTIRNGAIECENENQFLAIAAIRDDCFDNQYVWYNDILFKCKGAGSTVSMDGTYIIKLNHPLGCHFEIISSNATKATAAELIEYFKTKQS